MPATSHRAGAAQTVYNLHLSHHPHVVIALLAKSDGHVCDSLGRSNPLQLLSHTHFAVFLAGRNPSFVLNYQLYAPSRDPLRAANAVAGGYHCILVYETSAELQSRETLACRDHAGMWHASRENSSREW